MVDLSVVIVNWNVCDLLRSCLSSIAAGSPFGDGHGMSEVAPSRLIGQMSPDPEYRQSARASDSAAGAIEVIVVDSGSSDGSLEMVRREFPWARVIANSQNVGFIRGSNQGIEASQGRYVLLLNPDTEIVGDALSVMVDYADANPQVGALGPQLRYPDGTIQSSRRRFPTLATAFLESTVLQRWLPRHRVLDDYYVRDQSDDDTQEVDWVVGACLLLRREAIAQVGLLDESVFMYSDELDWCRRARSVDWRVVYLPAAQVVHHEGKSSDQAVVARHVHFQRSKIHYFRKHYGPLAGAILRLFLLLTYAYQLVEEAGKWLLGHKRQLRAQRVRTYWQVLASGLRSG
jgi:GT2 family glycosyltransferase